MRQDQPPSPIHRPALCLLVTQGGGGGAQRYVLDLARALKEQYRVTVAAGEAIAGRALLDAAAANGIAVHQLRYLRRAIRPRDDVRAIFELARFFRAGKFAIVHTNSSKADVLGAVAARLVRPRPRVVSTIHGWVFLEPMGRLRRALYVLLERIAARLRDQTIFLSRLDQTAAATARIGNPHNQKVIPLGIGNVTAQDRATARRRIGLPDLPPAATVVGTVANLYPTKGLDMLIRAAKTVTDALPDVRFVVIGEGPLRPRLEQHISKSKLNDRVFLVGSRPDAASLLAALDVFVLSSRKEGTPYVLLEAAAARLPVVATSVGGIPELLAHEKNGLLVPPDDPVALARELMRLCGDQALRVKLGDALAASTETRTLERMARATAETYERIIRITE